ncbi:hypothetical protein [Ornithinimicrobium sp. CNJ-824]|nr:hypothetical protein [Ornithinimicrobium sp. CNJ-824]
MGVHHLRGRDQPRTAADIVRAIWDIISQGVLNIGRFFGNIVNG